MDNTDNQPLATRVPSMVQQVGDEKRSDVEWQNDTLPTDDQNQPEERRP